MEFKKANTKLLILVVAAVLVLGIGYVFLNNSTESKSTGSTVSNSELTGNVVEITSSGFSPQTLTINNGDTVTWINKDAEEHWPASAMHPTHTKYAGGNYDEPGSYAGSLACASEGVSKTGVFDPCRGLSQGENWSFTFNELGNWSYHDHLNAHAPFFGKIIVK